MPRNCLKVQRVKKKTVYHVISSNLNDAQKPQKNEKYDAASEAPSTETDF